MGRERSRWYETKEFKSATDELGFSITKDPVHVHDLNATILQVLGFDHTKIKFRPVSYTHLTLPTNVAV